MCQDCPKYDFSQAEPLAELDYGEAVEAIRTLQTAVAEVYGVDTKDADIAWLMSEQTNRIVRGVWRGKPEN